MASLSGFESAPMGLAAGLEGAELIKFLKFKGDILLTYYRYPHSSVSVIQHKCWKTEREERSFLQKKIVTHFEKTRRLDSSVGFAMLLLLVFIFFILEDSPFIQN